MDVDLVFKIAAIGILVAVLNILLSRAGRDEQALLEPLAAFFRDAIAVSKLSGVYTGPLLKFMTISILTMIGESLCKDAGQAAGACAVQLVGVAAALYAALPLMRTFLTMIGECL